MKQRKPGRPKTLQDKKEKTVPVCVHLPESLKHDLSNASDRYDMSQSAIVRMLLREGLNQIVQ